MRGLLLFTVLPGCLWISPKEHLLYTDRDGDGVPGDLDCDDSEKSVHPGAQEQPCDDLDNDCNNDTPDGPVWLGRPAGEEGGPVVGTFETIADALQLAEPGALVGLCRGTFQEQVVIDKYGIVLAGSGGPELTILDGTGLEGPVIDVRAADVVIRQLTVTGGTGLERDGLRYGGGIHAIDAPGSVSIVAVHVTDNSADHGGGIAGPGASPLILGADTVIEKNHATSTGGGLYLTAEATLEAGAEISGNTADAQGGGIALLGGLITGGLVRTNTASDGGGLLLQGGTVHDMRLEGNIAASGRGGGVFGSGDLYGVTVTGNRAQAGGGLAAFADLRLYASEISDNSAQGGDGGGLLVMEPALATVGHPTNPDEESSFSRNSASATGGHIAVFGALELYGAELTAGTADQGGGVSLLGPCVGCTSLFVDTTFRSNLAREGGGLWAGLNGALTDCSFEENTATGAGGALFVSSLVVGERVTATANGADLGGFGAVVTNGVLDLLHGTLNANRAETDGAAVWGGGNITLRETQLESSQCTSCGALAAVDQGSLILDQIAVTNNEDYDVSFATALFCDLAEGQSLSGTCTLESCGDLCVPTTGD